MSDKEYKSRIRLLIGPAAIISVAYIDPGNFGSNISAGAKYGLDLLWVVWLSGLLAILFQYLAGKLGIYRNTSVFDEINSKLSRSKVLRVSYFTSTLIMILATDMAELTGIVIGLSTLLGISIEVALLLSFLDVILLFLAVDRLGRMNEVISLLVGVVGVSLLYELFIVGIDFPEIIRNIVEIRSLSGEASIYATAIVGATIMPHALLLHSYLAREEWGVERDLRRALRRHLVDTIAYLFLASILNASIQILSYKAFYTNNIHDVDTETAYYILRPLYGALASYVFGVALLASGISSSMVSIQTAVQVFDSFFSRRFESWLVRAIIRSINIAPLIILTLIGVNLIELLVYSQVILSLYLPLVLFPLSYYTSKYSYMKNLKNSRVVEVLAFIFSIIITAINLSLLTLIH
ncbi:MAG: Nramp family divalent metal transporter [Sulfolobales archaeon]